MNTYEGVDVLIYIFFTLALVGCEWSASRPWNFSSGERSPDTHWIGGWLGPRAGLDDMKKRKFWALTGLEFQTLCRPARRQSLFRLCYRGSKHATAGYCFERLFDIHSVSGIGSVPFFRRLVETTLAPLLMFVVVNISILDKVLVLNWYNNSATATILYVDEYQPSKPIFTVPE
jgi:hypothetical protein